MRAKNFSRGFVNSARGKALMKKAVYKSAGVFIQFKIDPLSCHRRRATKFLMREKRKIPRRAERKKVLIWRLLLAFAWLQPEKDEERTFARILLFE